jgi:hypothetical protein
MIHELRRLPPMHTAKIMALLYGVFFLLVSLILVPVILLGPSVDARGNQVHKGIFLGFMIAYPIFGLVFGWLGSALMSTIYNFIAKRFGGLRFQVIDVETPQ